MWNACDGEGGGGGGGGKKKRSRRETIVLQARGGGGGGGGGGGSIVFQALLLASCHRRCGTCIINYDYYQNMHTVKEQVCVPFQLWYMDDKL